jgi:hypothetical protein
MELINHAHHLKIKIKGHPDISSEDWFEYAIISHNKDGTVFPTIQAQDQSALMGVLVSLHNLGLEIICFRDLLDAAFSNQNLMNGK